MEPSRYRYAPRAAILLGGICLVLVPVSASAQSKFANGLRNAMNDVGNLLVADIENHRPQSEIRRLENALWDLSGGQHPGKAFGLGHHHHHHHHHGHFAMGMMQRERMEVRRLDRTVQELLAELEQRSHHHGRVNDGIHRFGDKSMSTKAFQGKTSTKKDTVKAFDPANLAKAGGDLVGNRVAKKTAVAAPGISKPGPNKAGPKNGICNCKAGGGAMQHQVKQGVGQRQACAKQGGSNFVHTKVNPGTKQNRNIAGKGGAPGNLIVCPKANAGGQRQQPFAKAPGNLVGDRKAQNFGGKAKAGGNAGQHACAKQGAGNFAGNKRMGQNQQHAAIAKNNGARNNNPLAGNAVGKNHGAGRNLNPLTGNLTPNLGAKKGAGNIASTKHAGKGAMPGAMAKNVGPLQGNRGNNPVNFKGQTGASKHGAGQMHHQTMVRGNAMMPHFTTGMRFTPHAAVGSHGHAAANIGRKR
jgi:hypothetical protein